MAWTKAKCALCSKHEAERVFSFADPDAPNGTATIVRCQTCGLRRLDPRPDALSVKKYYGPDYYTLAGRTRSNIKQVVWDKLRDLSMLESERSAVGQIVSAVAGPLSRRVFDVNIPIGPKPPRVIDVGCGFGDLLIYLKARGCDVLGIEFDPDAASLAASHGIPVHVGEISELDLEPSSFDVAIMSHSLEHVEDPLSALEQVTALLRPGGSVHIAVPNGNAPGLEIQKERWGALCYPVHFWYFDPLTLSSLLAKAGLAVTWSNSADIVKDHVSFWRRRLPEAPMQAVGELGLALTRRLRTPLSGDILRVVAQRPAGLEPAAAPDSPSC